MKVFKKFAGILLIVCFMVSMVAFAACGRGEGGVELKPGERVASEQEWQSAFDNVFNADNFTVKGARENTMTSGNKSYRANTNGKVFCDIKNKKFLMEKTTANNYPEAIIEDNSPNSTLMFPAGTFVSYCEARDFNFWTCENGNDGWDALIMFSSDNEEIFEEQIKYWISTYALMTTVNSIDDDGDWQSIKYLFSKFQYEDGYYVSEKLPVYGADAIFKVSIKDGSIAGISYTMTYGNMVDTCTQIICDVNSTTVNTPQGANEAIVSASAAKAQ